MTKALRDVERCKDCGDGKFVDEGCKKCLKPLLTKKPNFRIPCQFCGEKQDRQFNWKLQKVTCLDCKNIFRNENAKRRFKGSKSLKWTKSNYDLIVVAGEKLS